MMDIFTHDSKRLRTITLPVGLLFLMFSVVLFWPQDAIALPKVVAKVNGTVLTEADLEEALNEIMPAGVFHGGFSSEKREKFRPQAFEKMIDKELFYQEALKTGLTVDEAVILAERDRTIKRLGGEKQFAAALQSAGITDEQYQQKLQRKHLVKRLISVAVAEKARATDEEVRTYYRDNQKKYVRPEARRITQIMIAVEPTASEEEKRLKRAKAQEVIDKIRGGADMAKVAWEYSEDPYRVKGGDMGLVHRGRLYPDLEKEVFQLEPGRLSGIIETIYGYHIVRVQEVKPPEQLSLEEVYPKLEKELAEKKEKQIQETLTTRLRDQARIEKYQ